MIADAADIRRAARALLPDIETRAEEAAALRRLPLDLVAKLKATGVFRMAMPQEWGGAGMTPREQCELIEMLSAADPSIGWCARVGAEGGFFAAFLAEAPARELYRDVDFVTAAQVAPSGRAQRVPEGYRVSGRWGFASGCTHADVIAVQCLVFEGDRPIDQDATRMMLLPARSCRILDTWYTTGLAASGSHDVVIQDVLVPEEHTFSFLDRPVRHEPLYTFSGMFVANMPAVALGLASRATDTVRALLRESSVRDGFRMRSALPRAEMLVGAMRAYTYQTLDAIWSQLQSKGALTREMQVALGLSRSHAFRTARDVAQLMFDAAGARAVYSTSPLDRMLRDAVTMTQYVTQQDSYLEVLGSVIPAEAIAV
jgi:alkylation response protein AidB-like acyl-CoA dehydrogenase